MMFRLADRFVLTCCATLLSLAADASTHVSVYLKSYYTDYEIVRDCSDHDHLTAADAEMAKNAISKIEAYYLHQDPSINKDSLWKEAASNKDAALKMITRTKKVDPRQFCHASLDDLVERLHQIDSQSAARKKGS
jgi:hypothetical protein